MWNPNATERLEILLRCAVPSWTRERIRAEAADHAKTFSLLLHSIPAERWGLLLERALRRQGLPRQERLYFQSILGLVLNGHKKKRRSD